MTIGGLFVVRVSVVGFCLPLFVSQLFTVVGCAFALLWGLDFVLGLTTDVPVSHGAYSQFLIVLITRELFSVIPAKAGIHRTPIGVQ